MEHRVVGGVTLSGYEPNHAEILGPEKTMINPRAPISPISPPPHPFPLQHPRVTPPPAPSAAAARSPESPAKYPSPMRIAGTPDLPAEVSHPSAAPTPAPPDCSD